MKPAFVRFVAAVVVFAWMGSVDAVPQILPLLGGLLVTITSPASGSTVASTITVRASISVSDSLAAGVQFKLDGANLGAEDTSAPFAISWNTVTSSNGQHTLTAIARDRLGVRFVSAPVTVTAANDKTPPTAAVTFPVAGATVNGVISVTAVANDNVGVASIQFKRDGVDLGGQVTTAPYAVSWNTATVVNGPHTLTVIARDAAGNQATSDPVTVEVLNENPIVVENRQPGSGNWEMWLDGNRPADDVNSQIKGYASATSVNKGESITFYVTVNPAQTFTMDVYRMGWYQGLGGRLLQHIGPVNGLRQPACPLDITTGLIECPWVSTYALTVPTTWTSGVFLVQLTSAQGYQNYINFVVRDDARRPDILYQQSVTTYQAYNN